MALSKDDILNAIAEMSVMEVVELVEAMEEKFNVSAAAAVAAAQRPGRRVARTGLPGDRGRSGPRAAPVQHRDGAGDAGGRSADPGLCRAARAL